MINIKTWKDADNNYRGASPGIANSCHGRYFADCGFYPEF